MISSFWFLNVSIGSERLFSIVDWSVISIVICCVFLFICVWMLAVVLLLVWSFCLQDGQYFCGLNLTPSSNLVLQFVHVLVIVLFDLAPCSLFPPIYVFCFGWLLKIFVLFFGCV